jgi:hypothetical protein
MAAEGGRGRAPARRLSAEASGQRCRPALLGPSGGQAPAQSGDLGDSGSKSSA